MRGLGTAESQGRDAHFSEAKSCQSWRFQSCTTLHLETDKRYWPTTKMTMTSALIIKCSLLCNWLLSKPKSFLRNLNTGALPNNKSILQHLSRRFILNRRTQGQFMGRDCYFRLLAETDVFSIYFGKGLHAGWVTLNRGIFSSRFLGCYIVIPHF